MLRSIFVALIVALILITGRNLLVSSSVEPTRSVAIADILRDPGAYDGKPVAFRGVVQGRVSVFGVGAYRVGAPDGSSILVFGLSTAPAIGAETNVVGVFRMAAAVGDYQAPVVVAK